MCCQAVQLLDPQIADCMQNVRTQLHASLGLPLGLEAPIMTPNGVIFLFCSFTAAY